MVEVCDNGFDDDCDGSGMSAAGQCWLEGLYAHDSGDAVMIAPTNSRIGEEWPQAVMSPAMFYDGQRSTGWRTGGHGRYRHVIDTIPSSMFNDEDQRGRRRQLAGDEVGHR